MFILIFASAQMQAQTVWEQKKDKNGIKVFTANQGNSNYKSVRVECTVNAKFSQLIAFLFDIEKHKEWVYNTKSAQLCKRVSDSELIYYSEVTAPWPFSNRDFVAHLKVSQRSPGLLTIESHAEPGYLPYKKSCVRILNSDSYWTITAQSNNTLKLDYVIRFDPGGSIPAWLINLFITEGPYETFKNLRERVKSPAYQNAHYSFIRE
jgi:hypothetical protein